MRILILSLLLIIFLNCERDLSGIYEKNKNYDNIDTLFNSWADFAGVDPWGGAVGKGWYNAPPFMTCDHIFDDDFFLLYQYKTFTFSSILKTTSNPYVFALSILTKKYNGQNYAVFADTVDVNDSTKIEIKVKLDSIICLDGKIMPVDSIHYILIDIIRTDGLPTINQYEYSYYELTVTGERK